MSTEIDGLGAQGSIKNSRNHSIVQDAKVNHPKLDVAFCPDQIQVTLAPSADAQVMTGA
jgi:hypothetical protein